MLDRLRTPFLIAAVILFALAVAIEIGSRFFIGSTLAGGLGIQTEGLPRPGLGIPYLALVDGMALFTLLLISSALLIPERVQGRLQGIVTLIVSFLALLGAIAMIFAAIALLLLMVGLLLAVPFGTLAYIAKFGNFQKGAAAGTLGVLMSLKLAYAVCLILAHQRFLQNKGLVLVTLTSLLANLVVSFLHALVPRLLVSITDAVAAIIVGILGAIWALVYLIGGIVSIVKALRLDRTLQKSDS